ncbi:MAG: bifunctional nuclease family protein [Bacillati bacterium ANGP1]|uniref:Bifunctional nuclease family protein n=1 Tax=Candidatus Segetimicrobium genomatis TaxID=2569760 RepID=A0A537K0L7_9BACT|nr:MAG: bifunctional nuclease family protein [Terrabacteria group bacterium ANGP1]
MIGMKVRTVAMDQQMNPVVLLVDNAETLALPIWIGTAEAQSIALELQGVRMPRPMTHDLLRAILAQLTVSVNRIVVTDIQNGTYFAEIHLKNNGADVVIDSRPSDAIALALRTEAPIYVEEKVAANGIQLKKAFDEHEVEEFKKFLEKVKPQDFKQKDA